MHGGTPDPIVPNPLPGTRMDEPAYLAAVAAERAAREADGERRRALLSDKSAPDYQNRVEQVRQLDAAHEREVRDFPRTSSIVPMEAIQRDMASEQMQAHHTPISPLDGVGLPAHLRGGFPQHVEVGGEAPKPDGSTADHH